MEKHKFRINYFWTCVFHYIISFFKKLENDIKPNFSKIRIIPPLSIFSAFLKKNTMTKTSHFLSPNGQAFYLQLILPINLWKKCINLSLFSKWLIMVVEVEWRSRLNLRFWPKMFLCKSSLEERCVMCESELLLSKSHDFLAVFALAHSKINQIE